MQLENLGQVLKHDKFLFILLCIFNFGHCKLQFSSFTLQVSVVLKS